MEESAKKDKKKGKGIFLFLKASISSQIASWVDMGLSFVLFSVVNLTMYDGFFAKAIGAATGGVINCCINYKWTFQPEGCSKRYVAIKYAMVWVGSLLLNSFGTAFVTGIVNYVFFWNVALCGASGVCFAFILLSSFTKFREGEIPLTGILVAAIFLGQQIYEGITLDDNVSNMAHIIGGIVGGMLGISLNKKSKYGY